MRKTDLEEKYFVWLSKLVGVERFYPYREEMNCSYWEMFRILYEIPFIWFIPNDDNREIEGRCLRSAFCDVIDIDFDPSLFREEVSVLEVFIGISNRLERIMEGQDGGVKMDLPYWFWHILTNINLAGATDESSDNTGFYNYVNTNIQKVLNRTYERNGKGGLFPLKFDKKDQRKEEIWYQMSKYLMENYYGDLLKV